MRYLVGFMCVLAAGITAPLSTSAQGAEEAATVDPPAQEPEPSGEPAFQELALQLEPDAVGVDVASGLPRTADGYTLEDMDLRVRRARVGLLSTMGVSLLGGVLIGISISKLDFNTGEGGALFSAGVVVGLCGLVGMITTGGMLAHRKRTRRRVQEADFGRPHRVQWDLAQSRVVF